ncbi:flavodoxin family protein [Nonomuraea sp. NN258]|uniref:flavodoxin family protein n=1 Tax=Nonomuraea antri TaxID=2730852 RepID=UPI001568A622|nr:flavodoxin family protein [Nonomuraea antri]NRQ39732.1 flavodoxin family protein [Nonomuraea antri]
MSHPVSVVITYHSGYGHTARQAQAVARGARSVSGVAVGLRDVSVLDDELWHELDLADAIIFGTPAYFGSQSSVFQAFAEATAGIWARQGWQDKLAAGFTNSSGLNGDKGNVLASLAVFAAQHGMQWISLGLLPGWNTTAGSIDDLNRLGGFMGALAQSPADAPADVAPPDTDLRTAEHLGRRVAEKAVQWALIRRSLVRPVAGARTP